MKWNPDDLEMVEMTTEERRALRERVGDLERIARDIRVMLRRKMVDWQLVNRKLEAIVLQAGRLKLPVEDEESVGDLAPV